MQILLFVTPLMSERTRMKREKLKRILAKALPMKEKATIHHAAAKSGLKKRGGGTRGVKECWQDKAWDDYLYWQTQDKKT